MRERKPLPYGVDISLVRRGGSPLPPVTPVVSRKPPLVARGGVERMRDGGDIPLYFAGQNISYTAGIYHRMAISYLPQTNISLFHPPSQLRCQPPLGTRGAFTGDGKTKAQGNGDFVDYTSSQRIDSTICTAMRGLRSRNTQIPVPSEPSSFVSLPL